MRISPRIYVPALAAVVVSVAISWVFLRQIEDAVQAIEQGYLSFRPFSAGTPDTGNTTTGTPDAKMQSEALVALRQGEIFEIKGQWKDAEASYESSVKQGGGLPALRKLVSLQMQRREYDKAGATLKELRKEGVDPNEASLLEGLIALRSGRAGDAKAIFDRISDSPQGMYGLGLIALATADHETAKSLLTKVSESPEPTLRTYATTILGAYDEFALFPDSPDTHRATLLSRALAQVGECEVALPLLAKVVAEQDKYRDAWIVKGFCEFTSERLNDALISLERAYAIDPEKPETQYFLARVHAALGDPQNAITFLQYAIVNGFEPAADARNLLADYALQVGNSDLALTQYSELTKQDNADFGSFESYVNLALTMKGHEGDGYQAAKIAAKKWPDDPAVLTLLAKAALANGLPDAAAEHLKAALKIDPTYAKASELLAQIQGGATSSAMQTSVRK